MESSGTLEPGAAAITIQRCFGLSTNWLGLWRAILQYLLKLKTSHYLNQQFLIETVVLSLSC